jgi:hypothetical protein
LKKKKIFHLSNNLFEKLSEVHLKSSHLIFVPAPHIHGFNTSGLGHSPDIPAIILRIKVDPNK